jgi:hypothetical protein
LPLNLSLLQRELLRQCLLRQLHLHRRRRIGVRAAGRARAAVGAGGQ